MTGLLLHPLTKQQIIDFQSQPSHALILTGPTGSGKLSIANQISGSLLGIEPDLVPSFAYAKIIRPIEGKAIGIDSIRELEHFLSLKVPSHKDINRVVIIEDSHLLGLEAQNALLKTLEEPPAGTVLLLTAAYPQALLPTIHSRVQQIVVKRPELSTLETYYINKGFDTKSVKQILALSGGLPGLAQSLLNNSEHPLLPATLKARELLSQSTFERLAQVDELSRQRLFCQDILFIFQQMAHISLQNSHGDNWQRWKVILRSSYDAESSLLVNAQPKLALTDLMLRL